MALKCIYTYFRGQNECKGGSVGGKRSPLGIFHGSRFNYNQKNLLLSYILGYSDDVIP